MHICALQPTLVPSGAAAALDRQRYIRAHPSLRLSLGPGGFDFSQHPKQLEPNPEYLQSCCARDIRGNMFSSSRIDKG